MERKSVTEVEKSDGNLRVGPPGATVEVPFRWPRWLTHMFTPRDAVPPNVVASDGRIHFQITAQDSGSLNFDLSIANFVQNIIPRYSVVETVIITPGA